MKLFNLFNKKVFKIEPGLDRINKALEYIGNPHQNLNSVLVAGTNGKGSTSAYIESLFRYHRFKTGLFTSPHLIRENERWQVNRESIDDKKLENYIKDLKPVIEKFELTYFEASTLLAFKYFYDEKVDIAVVEVGLGGRWDATNTLYPDVSVITNVSFDHMHMLGNTLKEIAFEKTGITREDRPVIVGRNQEEIIYWLNQRNIKERYISMVDFKFLEKDFNRFSYTFRDFFIDEIELSMIGTRQIENASTGLTAFLVYMNRKNLKVDYVSVKTALKNTVWQGRMQIISKEPVIILDGAHNTEGLERTFKELKSIFPEKKIFTIYSFLKDKDIKSMFDIIKENSDYTLATTIDISRGMRKEDFESLGEYNFEPDFKTAIQKAVSVSEGDKIILITGSLYLIGEVLNGWNTVSK
ncbi:MAG: bifunctional folylpolyglutamate synthase/dihydrofolate synthase [Hydrogenothermaceae bacterium]|nr:bifunctional folylpolyglutamate synthase/dihydrofolate synthase [Hydrogenothermaceae bacterium]